MQHRRKFCGSHNKLVYSFVFKTVQRVIIFLAFFHIIIYHLCRKWAETDWHFPENNISRLFLFKAFYHQYKSGNEMKQIYIHIKEKKLRKEGKIARTWHFS